MKLRNLKLLLASTTLLAFNTACAKSDSDATAAVEAAPAEAAAVEQLEAAPAEAAPADATPASELAAAKFGEGMQIPVDGSSLEAFDESLAAIKEKATEAEYMTLTNALDYLLVYDLAAKRDRAKLAANLNGLTGEQIVDKVQWRKPPSQRN